MPKVGVESIRRKALVNAAIAEVGAHGIEVSVARIARRAGMSPALAHHYFGGKADMLEAALRAILSDYGGAVRGRLEQGGDRVAAIVGTSFGPESFRSDVIGAWLTFYLLARRNETAGRLLRVYQARLRSNLRHALRLRGHAAPVAMAERLAALIDGLYLRAALGGAFDGREAAAQVMAALEDTEV